MRVLCLVTSSLILRRLLQLVRRCETFRFVSARVSFSACISLPTRFFPRRPAARFLSHYLSSIPQSRSLERDKTEILHTKNIENTSTDGQYTCDRLQTSRIAFYGDCLIDRPTEPYIFTSSRQCLPHNSPPWLVIDLCTRRLLRSNTT